jgi:two-component system KDP operon response regulator KdpE
MASKILIVDDDASSLNLLRMHLERDRFAVLTAGSGMEGLRLAYEHKPDAVILDIRMPGMDGHEVCGRLRDISDAAILFVTVLKAPQDIVRGLELGADDYIIKPFNYDEFSARLQACLRRRAVQRRRAVAAGTPPFPWSLDSGRREVVQGNKRVQLTPKEFEVLKFFLDHPDKVLAADEILAQLWGPTYIGDPDLVKQFVYRLRAKLEDNPSEPQYLVTVRGAGYAFEPDTRPSIGKRPLPLPRPAGEGPLVFDSFVTPLGIRARNRQMARGLSIALASLIFLAGAAVAIAASSSIPGDLSYGLKLGAERIRLLASLSPSADLQLHLDHASSRVGELTQLVDRGRPEEIGRAADEYVVAVEKATLALDVVATEGQPDAEDKAAMFTAKLLSNLSLLEGLRGLVADGSDNGLAGAITATHKGLDVSAALSTESRDPSGGVPLTP